MGHVINLDTVPSNLLLANTVYIEHGSPWANSFINGLHGTNAECMELYRRHIANSPVLLKQIDDLQGMHLLGYVRGEDETSHGDVLLELAEMTHEERQVWAQHYLDN